MLFCKKWPKNDPQFLLHFLIHIMLCSKSELIPTSIFQVTAILKIGQNLKNHCTIAHAFLQKMTKKTLKIFITFSYTY